MAKTSTLHRDADRGGGATARQTFGGFEFTWACGPPIAMKDVIPRMPRGRLKTNAAWQCRPVASKFLITGRVEWEGLEYKKLHTPVPHVGQKEALVLRMCFLLAATLVLSLFTTAQTHGTVVATINIQRAIFDSKEGKHELARIHTKAPQERQQKTSEIGQGILIKMAPVIEKFALANGLGIIIETSVQLPDPIFWTKQHGGNVLRKQVDITKQIIDTFDGAPVHLPPISGDQSVLVVNIEKAALTTDDGKRELAAMGSKVTPEQKQKLSQGVLIKMTPVIAKIAGDSGADIVIDASQQWPNGSVLWFSQPVDLTDQVVSAYNGR